MPCSGCRRWWSGSALYLVLSRSGPLGGLGLLFTPGAMVAGASGAGDADRDRARPSRRGGSGAEYGDALAGRRREPAARYPASARDRAPAGADRRACRVRPRDLRSRRDPDRRRQHRRLHAHDDDGDRARNQQGQSDARARARLRADRRSASRSAPAPSRSAPGEEGEDDQQSDSRRCSSALGSSPPGG